MTNFEKIRKMLSEQLGISEDKITMETSLADDLHADSMDIMELVMTIQDEYSVEIPDGAIEEIKTVADIVNKLTNL